MVEELHKLRQSLKTFAGAEGPLAIYDAVVTAVNESNYTCDILIDEIEQPGVRLRAVVSDNHSVDVLPVNGAYVVVGKMGDDDYIVLACDKISSYQVTTGAAVFKVNSSGILISKGSETLNKILTDLVTAVLSIAAAKDAETLTTLLTRINQLLQ